MKRNWKLILVEAESTHPSDDYYEPQIDATPITSTDDFTQKVLTTLLAS
jgi:hypothetical protein